MCVYILVAWSLLVAAAVPQHEPSACLLQQGSSQRQRTVLDRETRQEPHEDIESRQEALGSPGENDESANDPAAEGTTPEKEASGEGKDDENSAKDDEKGGKDDEKGAKDDEKGDPDSKNETDNSGGGHADVPYFDGKDAPLSSLRLELRLPIPLNDLKESKGPLPEFLQHMRHIFAKVANISTDRLEILGVRGAYEDAGVSSLLERELKASLEEGPVLAQTVDGGHSIIDMEVLPGAQLTDISPKGVHLIWKEQLEHKHSPLKKGPLKNYLLGAKLYVRDGVEGLLPHEEVNPNGTSGWRLSLMALFGLLCLLAQ